MGFSWRAIPFNHIGDVNDSVVFSVSVSSLHASCASSLHATGSVVRLTRCSDSDPCSLVIVFQNFDMLLLLSIVMMMMYTPLAWFIGHRRFVQGASRTSDSWISAYGSNIAAGYLLSFLARTGWEMSSSLGVTRWTRRGPSGVVVCLHSAPEVQLFASAGKNSRIVRYHQLTPVDCRFRDGKALRVALISSAVASVRDFSWRVQITSAKGYSSE